MSGNFFFACLDWRPYAVAPLHSPVVHSERLTTPDAVAAFIGGCGVQPALVSEKLAELGYGIRRDGIFAFYFKGKDALHESDVLVLARLISTAVKHARQHVDLFHPLPNRAQGEDDKNILTRNPVFVDIPPPPGQDGQKMLENVVETLGDDAKLSALMSKHFLPGRSPRHSILLIRENFSKLIDNLFALNKEIKDVRINFYSPVILLVSFVAAMIAPYFFSTISTGYEVKRGLVMLMNIVGASVIVLLVSNFSDKFFGKTPLSLNDDIARVRMRKRIAQKNYKRTKVAVLGLLWLALLFQYKFQLFGVSVDVQIAKVLSIFEMLDGVSEAGVVAPKSLSALLAPLSTHGEHFLVVALASLAFYSWVEIVQKRLAIRKIMSDVLGMLIYANCYANICERIFAPPNGRPPAASTHGLTDAIALVRHMHRIEGGKLAMRALLVTTLAGAAVTGYLLAGSGAA